MLTWEFVRLLICQLPCEGCGDMLSGGQEDEVLSGGPEDDPGAPGHAGGRHPGQPVRIQGISHSEHLFGNQVHKQYVFF